MKRLSRFPILLCVLTAAIAFELLSVKSLPSIVASHFGVGGAANGFMPRGAYIGFMLALTVGLPLLLTLMHGSLRFVQPRFMNLPNREYWLAPERAEQTYAYLRAHGSWFAIMVAAFLCFVHGLVLQANAVQPPHLRESLLVAGLAVFVIVLVIWGGTFILHFRRRS